MEIVSQYLVYILLAFPILSSIVMLFLKDWKLRKIFVYSFSSVIAILSISLIALNFSSTHINVEVSEEFRFFMNYAGLAFSLLIAGVIVYNGIRFKNIIAIALAIVQLLISLFVEIFYVSGAEEPEYYLYYDSFTLIMVFIIGVIGSGICVYALGYMKDHNKHLKEGEKDRTRSFFAIMYFFLSAMFLIVFSNDTLWMFTGWEITTVCSFLLIKYIRTEEAIKNAFRQINLNLLGGIAFGLAIYFSISQFSVYDLNNFVIKAVANKDTCILPLFLFAFAALTKAAQMPFQSWLLGAMVAPTPTSALLHSSTMVKAGVFLLVKLSPVFYSTSMSSNALTSSVSVSVMLVGAVTFLICSFIAISQTNAKKVLAYSTIANLGLITTCAGVGSPFAIYAAVLLILFHACSKSLLFLCVGTAEHHIGSRNIEDMDLLFSKIPSLAKFMIVGMMAMFIAPFGMLVSKWAALLSFIYTNQIALIIILAFGSAATFMFWAKWIGKLTGVVSGAKTSAKKIHKSETISQIIMLICIILCIATLPFISDFLLSDYLYDAFSTFGVSILNQMYNNGLIDVPISMDCVYICIISLVIIAVILLTNRKNKYKKADIYLSGVSISDDTRSFKGSMNKSVKADFKNMYLANIFNEKLLTSFGSVLSIFLLCLSLLVIILSIIGVNFHF